MFYSNSVCKTVTQILCHLRLSAIMSVWKPAATVCGENGGMVSGYGTDFWYVVMGNV